MRGEIPGQAEIRVFIDKEHKPVWNIARDLALTSSVQGAWILDGWGGIHIIGDAESLWYSGGNSWPCFPHYDIAGGLQVIYYKAE